jgi:hypothetical protein
METKSDGRIMTLHPQGKQGVNIEKQKYDLVYAAIQAALSERGPLTFGALGQEVEERLAGNFDGSILWYYTTVKLDMEARGVVERAPGSAPQLVRLAAAKE